MADDSTVDRVVAWSLPILRRRGLIWDAQSYREHLLRKRGEVERLDALRAAGKPTFSAREIRRAEEEGRSPVPDRHPFTARGWPSP